MIYANNNNNNNNNNDNNNNNIYNSICYIIIILYLCYLGSDFCSLKDYKNDVWNYKMVS